MDTAIAVDLKKHLDIVLRDSLLVNEMLPKLSKAFHSCDISIFQKLLNLGMDPNLPLSGNNTPLTYLIRSATSGHWTEVAKLLIQRGASPNVTDSHGVPVVFSLVSAGEVQLLSLCMDHGVSATMKGPEGESLILAAVHYKQTECLRCLLKKGADVNASDADGNTAVMWAAGRSNGIGMQRSLSCLKILVEHGADVTICNKRGFSPLMAASLIRELEAVKILLNAGAHINLVDRKGETAIFKAVDGNAEEIVKYFLDMGADANIANVNGQTPLMRSSSYSVLERLLLAEADVNQTDQTGKSALHHMVEDDRWDMGKLLIEFGAYLNERTCSGETPLHLSIRRRSYLCAKLLMDAGSSLSSSNNDSITIMHDILLPWDYFCTCNIFPKLNTPALWRELIFYTAVYRPYTHRLLERFAKCDHVNTATADGVTPLMLAAGCGDLWAVKHLVATGADPLTLDEGGRSALSYAARSGNTELVMHLLHLGCDSNLEDHSHNLPIYYASYFKHGNIILILMVEFAFYYVAKKSCGYEVQT